MAFKIVLLGYMGSGKTTVGKELAQALQVSFMDLDEEIEYVEKSTVSEIFDVKGVIYFRKKEKFILEQIISSDDNVVLSLGGGTPCYFDTMNYLNHNKEVHTVYLDVAIPTLVNRLKNEMEHRPLLQNLNSKQELAEFIGKHLFERRPFYHQAKQTFRVVHESPKEIAKQIIASLF